MIQISTLKLTRRFLVCGLICLKGCACVHQTVDCCRLRMESPTRKQVSAHGLQVVDHLLIDSHLVGLCVRPVSSSFQLLSWSADTAGDFVRQKSENLARLGAVPPLSDGSPMNLSEWEHSLDREVNGIKTSGTMTLLNGGEAYYSRLEEAISGAEKSIDLRTFIFDNDDEGVRIADLLKRKSAEIPVRVLVDGLGQIMGEGVVASTLPEDHVSPGSMVRYLERDSRIKVKVRPNTWLKADHSKTIVIDGQVGFTGGMNIGREYRYEWHDLMVELEGPVVGEITEEFDLAWSYASGMGDLRFLPEVIERRWSKARGTVEDGQLPSLRILTTRPGDPQIFRAQIAAIRSSRRYIFVSNAYLSNDSYLAELIKARQRGVDVRVILSLEGNHEVMNKSNVVTANKLYANGVRVFFYPGMSHAKAAIYDGWLCTGSANLDRLSLKDNLELNLATSNPETTAKFREQVFDAGFEQSVEMTTEIDQGLSERIAEIIAEAL